MVSEGIARIEQTPLGGYHVQMAHNLLHPPTESAQPLGTPFEKGESRWIKCMDRMPTPAETHQGRVPVLDAEGFLVIALLHNGHFICETVPVYWTPVSPTYVNE